MPEGERHVIRAITDPATNRQISSLFTDLPLYIADGHHRYTSALTYRREKTTCSPGTGADDPVNFVMITLVDFADPGLVILAPQPRPARLAKILVDRAGRQTSVLLRPALVATE